LNRNIITLLLLLVLVGAGVAWQMSRSMAAEQQVQALVKKARAQQELDIGYEKVSASFMGNEVSIHQVRLMPLKPMKGMPMPMRIDKLVLGAEQMRQEQAPDQADVQIQGAQIPVDALGLAAAERQRFVKAHGEVLRLDADLHYRYDPETRALEMSSRLGAERLGNLYVSLALGNVMSPRLDADPLLLQQGLMTMTIKAAALRYQDAGLVDSLFQENAARMGMDLAAYKAQLVTRIDQRFPAQQPASTQRKIPQALKAFIDDPQTLQIQLKPDGAVPVMGLMAGLLNPLPLLEMLNVSVTAH
jgi:hypothetical protein